MPKKPSMASTTDNETILRSVLDDWKAACLIGDALQAVAGEKPDAG